jgi:hypothetical protein
MYWTLNTDEVTEYWRRLHTEELHNLYSSRNIVQNEMGRACSMYVGDERCIQGFRGEI